MSTSDKGFTPVLGPGPWALWTSGPYSGLLGALLCAFSFLEEPKTWLRILVLVLGRLVTLGTSLSREFQGIGLGLSRI